MNVNAAKYDITLLIMSDFVNAVTRPYIQGMLQGAKLNGYSPEVILEKAGLSRDLLADPEAVIDGAELQNLWLAIMQVTGDYFMGFLNQPAKPAMDFEQYKARSRAKLFGEFIQLSTRFREIIRNDVHYEYLTDHKRQVFTLVVQYQLRQGVDEHIFYWHRLMLIYRYYSWVIGKRIKLHKVYFATPEPDYCMDYPALFNSEVLFGQAYNAISFSMSYLQNPVVRSEIQAHDFVLDNPDWLTAPGQDVSWTRQVEDVLHQLQNDDIWYPSIARVAAHLSVTPRALRRELQKENETFHNIRQCIRAEAAKKMLASTNIPITRLATQLGYTEPGVFTRAFTNWTSMTPSAYRAEHQKSQRC